MGNMTATESTHRGLKIFLAFVLTFSLLSVAVIEEISAAFADEPESSIEQPQFDTTNNDDPNEDDAMESGIVDKDAMLDTSSEDNNTIMLEDIALQSEQASSQSLGDNKDHYVYKHVYQYVYGSVFNDEYAIATNAEGITDDWSSWNGKTGRLLSASQGEVFPEGIEFNPITVYSVINGGLKHIPFKQNGKWGLIDFNSKQIVVDARYEIVSTYVGGRDGNSWAFISEGSVSSDGTHPNAKVYIYSSGTEVFNYGLENYVKGGYSSFYTGSDGSNWSISWTSKRADGEEVHTQIRVSESDDGFKLVGADGSMSYAETPDGHKVYIYTNEDKKIAIKVIDPNGEVSDSKVLGTDQTNRWNFTIVSNLIEVRSSNGFDYQYFTLDGNLLQNLNGQSFYGLGNYVAFNRIDFTQQIPAQQFLDTNNITSQDAVSIPAFAAHFESKNNSSFECITPDNKIQRYDVNLNKVMEFDTSLDVAGLYEQGYRYFDWKIVNLFDRTWAVTESAGYDRYNISKRAFHVIQRLNGVDKSYEHTFFGLDSPNVNLIGTPLGKICLMEDDDAFKLRFFNQDLSFYSEFDASVLFPQGSADRSIGFGDYGHDQDLDFAQLTVNYRDNAGRYYWDRYILDSGFNLTDFDDISSLRWGYYVASKDGKRAIIDSNFNPLTGYVYDSVWIAEFDNDQEYIYTRIGDYTQVGDGCNLLDKNLNDVLGFSFSDITELGNSIYKIKRDGYTQLYHGSTLNELIEIPLMGYKLLDKQLQMIRPLPNGNKMIYVQNSEGKIGAIDNQGSIVIPFEFFDYAENTDRLPGAGYIMLKDEQGWFFVYASELQNSGSNDECDLHGHDFMETMYEPTCTSSGYVQKVCKRCGYGERDENSIVAALGHDYRQLSFEKEPTCTEEGAYDYFECSRCDARKGNSEVKTALGHLWDPNSQYIQYPTCTEDGSGKHTCLRCGVEEEYVVSAYGHRWSYSPEWTWSSDFQTVTARTACTNGCGEYLPLEVSLDHENVEGGTRHSAVVNIDGRDVKDGRLTLGWTDENGVSRNLLVKGAPVADGFYAWPQDLKIPADEGSSIVIDVTPVHEGGIFDALVSKIGSGWPAGTFEVKLNIDDDEVHDGFGSLKFAFPAGGGSTGKKAVIYHCHKNDRDNITSHDVVVDDNGMIVLDKITDLSTFALEILEDEATSTGPSANNSKVSGLPSTGDSTVSLMVVVPLALECLAFAIAFFFILRRRRSC